MRRILVVGALTLGALAIHIAPAGAAPTVPAGCKAGYPGTVGECISGFYYGNTSNPSGNGNGVLPSLTPGPWKCTAPGCSGAVMGNPVGYYNGGGTPVGHSQGTFPFGTRADAIYG